ncbi:MAG TPA: peptidylprolyl isomerase [Alphaproteobacteria bacterium]
MRRFVFRLSLAALLLPAGIGLPGALPAWAQEVQRIAAVVNDEAISLYDLATRTRLAIVSSGLPDTPDVRRRIQPQVMRALIDEKIQAQEAIRQNITVSDAELADAIAHIEQRNRMPRGGLETFIQQNGLDRNSVMTQIRNGLLWQKLVTRRLRANAQVSEEEIDEQLARLREAQGRTEYQLSEIFLAVDSPENEEEIRQAAVGLAEQIRHGAPISEIARQFSQSASAATGGDIGWIQKGTLEPNVEAIIDSTPIGQVTDPIRSVGGYYIYGVRQKRMVAAASPNDAHVTLSQLLIPVDGGTNATGRLGQKELAETVRDSVSGCADFGRVAKELGAPPPPDPQRLRVGDLAPRIREIVTNLKVGEVSEPIEVDQGVLVLMVCQREEAQGNMPTRDEIAEGLVRQRLDLLARRYLRDLRRAAFIDVRV